MVLHPCRFGLGDVFCLNEFFSLVLRLATVRVSNKADLYGMVQWCLYLRFCLVKSNPSLHWYHFKIRSHVQCWTTVGSKPSLVGRLQSLTHSPLHFIKIILNYFDPKYLSVYAHTHTHTMRIRAQKTRCDQYSSAYINQVGKEIKNGIWLWFVCIVERRSVWCRINF